LSKKFADAQVNRIFEIKKVVLPEQQNCFFNRSHHFYPAQNNLGAVEFFKS